MFVCRRTRRKEEDVRHKPRDQAVAPRGLRGCHAGGVCRCLVKDEIAPRRLTCGVPQVPDVWTFLEPQGGESANVCGAAHVQALRRADGAVSCVRRGAVSLMLRHGPARPQ